MNRILKGFAVTHGFIIVFLLFLPGRAAFSQLNDITVNFTMMSPHVGQDFWLAVIDTESGQEAGRSHVVGAESFVMQIPGILEDGKSYQVDFFADLNRNGYYDPPRADHAWRLSIDNASGNETLAFSHQLEFTDIEWKYRLRLSLSGMSAGIGQAMTLFVREPSSGAYLDTVLIETIADGSFTMDSYAISPGSAYMLDFFSDLNGNGVYDPPPVDQAWRLKTNPASGDLDLEFSHHEDYYDISAPVGVSPGLKEDYVTVYPNPVAHYLFVSMEDMEGSKAGISIINTAGIKVLSRNFSEVDSSRELDVSSLPPGLYILRVENKKQSGFTRFVKL